MLLKLEKQVYDSVFAEVYNNVSKALKMTELDEVRIANEFTESVEALLKYKQSKI